MYSSYLVDCFTYVNGAWKQFCNIFATTVLETGKVDLLQSAQVWNHFVHISVEMFLIVRLLNSIRKDRTIHFILY